MKNRETLDKIGKPGNFEEVHFFSCIRAWKLVILFVELFLYNGRSEQSRGGYDYVAELAPLPSLQKREGIFNEELLCLCIISG